MAGAIGIVLVALGAGFVVVTLIPWSLRPGRRLLWLLPLGLEGISVTCFLLSWALGTVGLGWATTVGVVAGGLVVLGGFPGGRRKLKSVWAPSPASRGLKGRREWLPLAAVFVPWVGFALVVYPRLLVDQGGGLTAGWPTVWADWSAHLRTATFLADQGRFSLENSLLSGVPARYPLAEDFLTSLFLRAGVSPVQALLWSGLPFFLLLPALVQTFLRRTGLSPWVASLGTFLFLAAGGFGFLGAVWNPDPFKPGLADLWFQNFVTSEFLPQRAFAFGLPGALVVLGVFLESFALVPTRRQRWTRGLGLGAGWAALLLVHTHSALALGLVFAVGAGTVLVREGTSGQKIRWAPAGIFAASGLGLGGLVFGTFLMDPGKTGGLVHLLAGWVPHPMDPLSTAAFLFQNLGLILATALLSLGVGDRRTRFLTLAALGIFVVANLVAFQPWVWDNEKLLTWWYLLAVAASLSGWKALVRTRRRFGRAAAGFALALVAVGASASGLWNLATLGAVASQPRIPLVGEQGVTFAREVGGRSGVVALAPDHDHPLALLSGLRIYLGYTGWVWSYGLPYQDRLDQLTRIYSGGPRGLEAARKAGVSWVALGPPEERQFHADRDLLEKTFPVAVREGAWELLEVPHGGP